MKKTLLPRDVVSTVSQARAEGGVARAREATLQMAEILSAQTLSNHSTIIGFASSEFDVGGTLNNHVEARSTE
jgi:hypothetical protein